MWFFLYHCLGTTCALWLCKYKLGVENLLALQDCSADRKTQELPLQCKVWALLRLYTQRGKEEAFALLNKTADRTH